MEEKNSGDLEALVSRPPLEAELQTFEELLPILLKTNPGEWALIKEQELGGIFPDHSSAIDAGYEFYGNVPFLTRQILLEQPEHFYNSVVEKARGSKIGQWLHRLNSGRYEQFVPLKYRELGESAGLPKPLTYIPSVEGKGVYLPPTES